MFCRLPRSLRDLPSMPAQSTRQIDCTRVTPSLRVRDITRALEFYTSRLGFTLGFTWGEPVGFAGVKLGEVQIFLQQGDPGTVPGQLYFFVDDADALHV